MENSPCFDQIRLEHKLHLSDDNFIAYHKHDGKKNNVGVIFLSGFMSDMSGIKATELDKFCKNHNYPYIRFDYFGHGKSSKKFTECNIGIWKQNVLDVLDNLTTGKQILIGSSMGGWLMLLAALERPERIAGLIGIASAPDFTEDLIWNQMTHQQQKELLKTGIFDLKSEFSDNPYPVTLDLIEEGRKHLLLRDNKTLPITCPVRLIHGLNDTDVPSSISTQIALHLASPDVKVNLVKDGDHRMSTPENIELLCNTLEDLMTQLAGK
jgi:pimeloyl-ACP methyl ester carboxylesterase